MDEKTKELVEAAEARALAATPGPWTTCTASDGACSCGLVWAQNPSQVVLVAKMHDDEDMLGDGPTHAQRVKNGRFAAHARADVPVLCAIIREQAAQLELLAKATKVGAGETLVLVAGEGVTGEERRAAAEALRGVCPGPLIVLPHGWSTVPANELRKALERAEPTSS